MNGMRVRRCMFFFRAKLYLQQRTALGNIGLMGMAIHRSTHCLDGPYVEWLRSVYQLRTVLMNPQSANV
jgi:hypothetical protein